MSRSVKEMGIKMYFFKKIFKTKTTELKFDKVEDGKKSALENQNGRIENFGRSEIVKYIQAIVEDNQQFVILELPEARYGVRYVQACVNDGKICVQLGMEEENQTKLVEKFCSEEECRSIFLEFFDCGYVNDIETYKPVEFLV